MSEGRHAAVDGEQRAGGERAVVAREEDHDALDVGRDCRRRPSGMRPMIAARDSGSDEIAVTRRVSV